jgi:voltage-gated potassium channel
VKPLATPGLIPAQPAPTQAGMARFSARQFLLFLVFFFVSAPFVEKLPHGDFIDGGLLTLVLVSGVLAVGSDRKTLWLAGILVAPVIIGRWMNQFHPGLVAHEIFIVAGLVFIVFLIAHLLRFILRAPRVTSEVLCAGISTYLLLGMLWMFAYLLVAELVPGAFSFSTGPESSQALSAFNAYYFSFITLCTVGYGDVVPVSHVARMLATMEAITGTLFMAVLIARLVALYSTRPPTATRPDERTDSQPKEFD